MDLFETLSSYYSGVLICGVVLLGSACVFAYVDMSKNSKSSSDPNFEYVWRALSITCFVVGLIMLLGLLIMALYRRCSRGARYERLNQTDIELTAR
ncbi:putative IMV phosphorylated membrane protein [Parapoxvirus red deer/HL953]|uniref:Putative IMV phosphorylated membrane protein n=1 Tax=Parapoxvirus red deer/HL953 TaxID=1579460 RepID=A0A0A7MEU4_9POXV|nr:putative IMV phosphorylated membrane protein [Parapoxvirus red deer/HL953]AIZ77341.1 putative IMV phosphorylated membrane protein [Parapoxvirus red deer/HL953]